MNKALSAFALLAVASAAALPAPSMAQAPARTKAGTLTCDISAGMGMIIGSKKDMSCMFTPSRRGSREVYVGSISKFGVALVSQCDTEEPVLYVVGAYNLRCCAVVNPAVRRPR